MKKTQQVINKFSSKGVQDHATSLSNIWYGCGWLDTTVHSVHFCFEKNICFIKIRVFKSTFNLDFYYNWMAALIWLGAVIVLAILASLWPARTATKISVRQSLSYA